MFNASAHRSTMVGWVTSPLVNLMITLKAFLPPHAEACSVPRVGCGLLEPIMIKLVSALTQPMDG